MISRNRSQLRDREAESQLHPETSELSPTQAASLWQLRSSLDTPPPTPWLGADELALGDLGVNRWQVDPEPH